MTNIFEILELIEAIIRVNRIRGGKIQRNKKVSTNKNYRLNKKGKPVRISARERRKRKLGARRAAIKRRSHLSQSLRRRKISLRRRKTLGGGKRRR